LLDAYTMAKDNLDQKTVRKRTISAKACAVADGATKVKLVLCIY